MDIFFYECQVDKSEQDGRRVVLPDPELSLSLSGFSLALKVDDPEHDLTPALNEGLISVLPRRLSTVVQLG